MTGGTVQFRGEIVDVPADAKKEDYAVIAPDGRSAEYPWSVYNKRTGAWLASVGSQQDAETFVSRLDWSKLY